LNKETNDEVDLIELLNTIWIGKWTILGFVIIPLVLLFIYDSTRVKTFTAITLILPPSTTESSKYKFLTLSPLTDLTPKILYDRYTEKLEQGTLLRDAIVESGIVKIEDYENKIEFRDAVTDLASEIKILSPVEVGSSRKGRYETIMVESKYPIITFTYNNRAKWSEFLSILNSSANEAVRKDVQNELLTVIAVKKLELDFKKEKAEVEIDNALLDYEAITERRLLFLEEQTAIAKKLGIKDSAIHPTQQLNSGNPTTLALIETSGKERPFYLNGFNAIDEEIRLIKKRVNKAGFIDGFLLKKQSLRVIDQNIEIIRLETLAKLASLTNDNFTAGVLDYDSTFYTYKSRKMLLLLITFIISFAGVVFVLLRASHQRRTKA